MQSHPKPQVLLHRWCVPNGRPPYDTEKSIGTLRLLTQIKHAAFVTSELTVILAHYVEKLTQIKHAAFVTSAV